MKVGVFGGSFNPIHNGHLMLAQNVLCSGYVDELIFVVSPLNPLKDKSILHDDAERLEQVRKATAYLKGVVVSDVEFHMPKPSYMYLTLRKLQQQMTGDELYLVIGADNWQCFDAWKNNSEILQNYHILIYPRKGSDIDKETLPANVTYLEMPTYNISSTMIRKMASEGKDVGCYVPPEIN